MGGVLCVRVVEGMAKAQARRRRFVLLQVGMFFPPYVILTLFTAANMVLH